MTPEKEAQARFRFKNRVCFKKCGLWEGRGGFCPAKKENIDYCLTIDKSELDTKDYRSLQNIIEWLEVFAEEKGILMYKPTEETVEKAKILLEKTRYDCYQIAEKLI